ncbi:MAG: hypothetical protein IJD04_08960 [Desulfovibrionaceae bacterium]|nr:hypothetical protein [Desulfovibrionaceae bacterium]
MRQNRSSAVQSGWINGQPASADPGGAEACNPVSARSSCSSFFYFDRQDDFLVDLVNRISADRAAHADSKREKTVFRRDGLMNPELHPNGIRCMAVSREERIAHAVVNLLESLEEGSREQRLEALSILYDEVISSSVTAFRVNTGRVLIQIMKELVRSRGNRGLQEKLAHDFRAASAGKPHVVRRLLARYNLLEMPEDGSQIAFDNHVHDLNTKGRKSPTHLIMDAWVKGIGALSVVYYNHVETGAAYELLEAARIMGLNVRIGIEFNCRFYEKRARIVWVPRGFPSSGEFIDFLKKTQVQLLMQEGREASLFREKIVFDLLENFNRVHLSSLNRRYGVALPKLNRAEFESFVGRGQASRLHLAEFILRKIEPLLEEKPMLQGAESRAPENGLPFETVQPDSEGIQYAFLSPEANPGLPDPDNPADDSSLPPLLQYDAPQLVRRLNELHSGSDIVLSLTCLALEDAVEILYDCEGLVSHIELFNYKDYVLGRSPQTRKISMLQTALNEGKTLLLKRMLRRIIRKMRGEPESLNRLDKFERILRNITHFQGFYAVRPLGSRLGSDSTGRSKRFFGMGLAFIETLPRRARRAINRRKGLHLLLPVRSLVYRRIDYLPRQDYRHKSMKEPLPLLPFLWRLGWTKRERWAVKSRATCFSERGNVVTLGSTGGDGRHLPKLSAHGQGGNISRVRDSFFYLNTNLKDLLKITVGLLVATLTFMYTQSWWVLAFLGGAIWLGITCLRNILQAVLGGGGLQRPGGLHWNDFVDWSRIADSLFYTGFSVLLLELGVRVLLLQDLLRVNADSHPILVYTVISLVNGLYISSHNFYRGLPRQAAIGNLFRSALAIPTALLFNAAFYKIMVSGMGVGHATAESIMIQSASIISKLASDSVAGVIEGLADRGANLQRREFDYACKLKRMFDAFTELELLFPHKDMQAVLAADPTLATDNKAGFCEAAGGGNSEAFMRLERKLTVDALDMMYFWYCQPRSRETLRRVVGKMTREEKMIFWGCQNLLSHEGEVSALLEDELFDKDFRAQRFYLKWRGDYLDAMRRISGV